MNKHYTFPVQVYYEDTDFSGLVYHANYLKFCERAREHVIGVENLVTLYNNEGLGFVVYKSELNFKDGAEFGDELEVRSHLKKESEYRVVFVQDIFRKKDNKLMVSCINELVCVDNNKKMVVLPALINEFI